LEHENACLYAELIQIVHKNKSIRGWVRPLFLKVSHPRDSIAVSIGSVGDPISSDQPKLYDLRQGADLLCPIALFRAALDTEVVPLLTHLADSRTHSKGDRLAHKQLQRFICDVCQIHSEAL
jgi:hypothetical protein